MKQDYEGNKVSKNEGIINEGNLKIYNKFWVVCKLFNDYVIVEKVVIISIIED